MKKLYTTIILASFVALATAQPQLPNAGFETWAPDLNFQLDPFGYNTSDSLGFIDNGVEGVVRVTDAHTGQYAVKLLSTDTVTPPVVGVMALGPSIDPLLGVPFNGQPTKLRGWYKANLGSELASITLVLKSAGVQVADATYSFSSVAGWTMFEVPIAYVEQTIPDTLTLVVYLGGNAQGEMTLDDLELVYGPDDVFELKPGELFIYPNPSNGTAFLQVKGFFRNCSYEVTDVAGRVVKVGNIENTGVFLELKGKGIFTVTVRDASGHALSRRKLSVQ